MNISLTSCFRGGLPPAPQARGLTRSWAPPFSQGDSPAPFVPRFAPTCFPRCSLPFSPLCSYPLPAWVSTERTLLQPRQPVAVAQYLLASHLPSASTPTPSRVPHPGAWPDAELSYRAAAELSPEGPERGQALYCVASALHAQVGSSRGSSPGSNPKRGCLPTYIYTRCVLCGPEL